MDKAYYWGSRAAHTSYCFLNQVRFPQKGVMQVETVFLDAQRCSQEPRQGVTVPACEEIHTFRYVSSRGRFVSRSPKSKKKCRAGPLRSP